jgi:hypothetical protein
MSGPSRGLPSSRILRYAAAMITLGIMALGLSACAGDTTKVDAALSSQNVQNGIQLACATFTGISVGYDIYVADHHVSEDAAKAVAAAKAALFGDPSLPTADQKGICTPPYPDSSATAIAAVMRAGANVYKALQDSKKAEELASAGG